MPRDAIFPTYSDLSAFAADPLRELPERPTALFVGMLEPYKNVEGLAAAWRRVVQQLPEAQLVVVGPRLAAGAWSTGSWRRFPSRSSTCRSSIREGVARALDEATRARAPVLAGGPGPRRDRGLRPGPGRRGD